MPKNIDVSDQNANLEFTTSVDENNNNEYATCADLESNSIESLDKIYKKKFSDNILKSDSSCSTTSDKQKSIVNKPIASKNVTNNKEVLSKDKTSINNNKVVDKAKPSKESSHLGSNITLEVHQMSLTPESVQKQNNQNLAESTAFTIKSTDTTKSNVNAKTQNKIIFDPNLDKNVHLKKPTKVQSSKTSEKSNTSSNKEAVKAYEKPNTFKIPRVEKSSLRKSIDSDEMPSTDSSAKAKSSEESVRSDTLRKNSSDVKKQKSDAKKVVTFNSQHQSINNMIKSNKIKKKTKEISKKKEAASILEKLKPQNPASKLDKSKLIQNTNNLSLTSLYKLQKELTANIGLKSVAVTSNPVILINNFVNKSLYTQYSNIKLLCYNSVPRDFAYETNYELNKNEKLELFDLIKESEGKINFFELLGFGEGNFLTKSFWSSKERSEIIHSEEFKKKSILGTLSDCPMTDSYEFYCSLRERASMPYRCVEPYWISKFDLIKV